MSAYFQMGSQNREALRRKVKELNARAPAVQIIRCAPGGCEYLRRDEQGRLCECGQPATHKGNTARGLRYCKTCVEFASRGRHGIECRELQPHELTPERRRA